MGCLSLRRRPMTLLWHCFEEPLPAGRLDVTTSIHRLLDKVNNYASNPRTLEAKSVKMFTNSDPWKENRELVYHIPYNFYLTP